MRLVTYAHRNHADDCRAGVVQGDRILDVAALLSRQSDPQTADAMLGVLDAGPASLDRLSSAVTGFADEHQDTLHVPADVALPLWESTLMSPLPRPRSFRDFSGFEQHQAAAFAKRGRPVPPAWYEIPVFSYCHTGNFFGPEAMIPMPETAELDFELELACVIGQAGRDIRAADASEYIAGFTILNDWSARDLQRQEMPVGLGPAKGKDFATSLGPFLVTIDELSDRLISDRLDLWMVARINGEEVSRANANTMHWSFAQMIERASHGVDLRPGDLIGSGTAGTGCLFELGEQVHPWLQPGDEVELEIERLGRLRNVIGEMASSNPTNVAGR